MINRSLAAAVLVSVAIAVTGAQPSPPKTSASPDVELKTIATRELFDGNIQHATEQYRALEARSRASRPDVAAEALIRIARNHERLGDATQASATYQRVVTDFPQAGNVTTAARTRLAAMQPVRVQGAPAFEPRKIGMVSDPIVIDVSKSGDHILINDGNDLVIRGVHTGQTTMLVPATPTHRGVRAVFSPDARQVAYTWANGIFGSEPASTYIVGTEPGAKPRFLTGPDGRQARHPVTWSRDGQEVLVGTATGLQWVKITDGSLRLARTRSGGQLRNMRVSPDGRFVAYQSGAAGSARIFVAALEGGGETEVVNTVGSHSRPVWTPDGSHLLFVSDRSGEPALWSVPIQGGQASGSPSLVRSNFRHRPMAVSESGSLFYEEFVDGGTQTYIVERIAATPRLLTSFPGDSGTWSPDGRLFAFRPQRGAGEVIVRDMDTGAERSYRHDSGGQAPRWLGNSGFVVRVTETGGPATYFCDIATGVFRRLHPVSTSDYRLNDLTMPDDGSRIYYVYRKGPGTPVVGVLGINPTTNEIGPVVAFSPAVPAMWVGHDVNNAGTHFAFMAPANADQSSASIFVMAVDGSGTRQVGGAFPVNGLRGGSDLIKWTPDGAGILYVTADVHGRSRVMRIPATGGVPEFEGIETAGQIYSIDLSPDGARLAYNGSAPATSELWVVDNILAAIPR